MLDRWLKISRWQDGASRNFCLVEQEQGQHQNFILNERKNLELSLG